MDLHKTAGSSPPNPYQKQANRIAMRLKIPKVPVTLDPTMGPAEKGRTFPETRSIKINPVEDPSYEQITLRDSVCHEMAHVLCLDRDPKYTGDHGDAFCKALCDVMVADGRAPQSYAWGKSSDPWMVKFALTRNLISPQQAAYAVLSILETRAREERHAATLRVAVPEAPRVTSRKVNKYVRLGLEVRALKRELTARIAERNVMMGTMTGGQLGEADRVLAGGAPSA
jgi:hypothetical protein